MSYDAGLFIQYGPFWSHRHILKRLGVRDEYDKFLIFSRTHDHVVDYVIRESENRSAYSRQST